MDVQTSAPGRTSAASKTIYACTRTHVSKKISAPICTKIAAVRAHTRTLKVCIHPNSHLNNSRKTPPLFQFGSVQSYVIKSAP